MTSKIGLRLDGLASLRKDLEVIEARCEASIHPTLKDQRDSLKAAIKQDEGDIKQAAKHITVANRHTLRGKILQLVLTNKVSYSKADIERVVPESFLSQIRKTAEVWSIRKAAAK